MADLKLWTDGTDTFIADSLETVKRLYAEQYGYERVEAISEDIPDEFDPETWDVYEDNREVTIWDTADEWRRAIIDLPDTHFKPPEDCMIACRAKASEWVKIANGKPMFLCSTEW